MYLLFTFFSDSHVNSISEFDEEKLAGLFFCGQYGGTEEGSYCEETAHRDCQLVLQAGHHALFCQAFSVDASAAGDGILNYC
jgi:hypothetical protein